MDAKHYDPAKIIELRKKAGWTQAQFADEMGVVPMTIYRVEKGLVVSFDLLMRIAGKFSVAVTELLRDESEPSDAKKISLVS